MQKLQKVLNVSILATEASHIFCCVLPTVFSLLSLMAGIGLIGAIPPGIDSLHDVIHDWELPIIVTSGIVLAIGWWVHDYSKKIDCRDNGCGHGPCDPKKKRSAKILKIASVLFIVNVSVYFLIHLPHNAAMHAGEHVEHAGHDHHDHHGHDH